MKKILTRIVIGLVLLGGAFCVATWFIPSKVHVERSITINTPASVIFPHVNDLEAWEQWSPWYELEPTAQYTYGEQTVGTGATSAWKGELVGEGSQVIMSSLPNSEIQTALDDAARQKMAEAENQIAEWSGQLRAAGDLLYVQWTDGSLLNFRWSQQGNRLLLTNHLGQISQLQRIFE